MWHMGENVVGRKTNAVALTESATADEIPHYCRKVCLPRPARPVGTGGWGRGYCSMLSRRSYMLARICLRRSTLSRLAQQRMPLNMFMAETE